VINHPSQYEHNHWMLCICQPENFDYRSAAGIVWLHLATINRQILEISQEFYLCEFDAVFMEQFKA